MRLKPFFNLEELCYLASKVKFFKKTVTKKRLQRKTIAKQCCSSKVRLLKKLESINPLTQALNVVRYNTVQGVGLKTVDIPQLQGTTPRYMIKPIPIVASNPEVYAHVLDIIYPEESSTEEDKAMREKAKITMSYLVKLRDKSTGPTVELNNVMQSMKLLEASVMSSSSSSSSPDHRESAVLSSTSTHSKRKPKRPAKKALLTTGVDERLITQ